ncbi:MAG: hypothetical protein V7763_07235 [Sulfitobacter sp.]
MNFVYRLILILALSFGVTVAPDVSPADTVGASMPQMDTERGAQDKCDGCISRDIVNGAACESGGPVPCGASGSAAILNEVSIATVAGTYEKILMVADPTVPPGTSPSLDPFPPRNSV